jgi:hypothetical protein
MWALREDYRTLSPGQRGQLAELAALNKPLDKGCLIKEQIRQACKAIPETSGERPGVSASPE